MKTKFASKLYLVLVAFALGAALIPDQLLAENPPPPNGMQLHSHNGRYFTDDGGKAVYLTGSHTWNNFLDGGWEALGFTNPSDFNFPGYLNWMNGPGGLGHNFIRLWTPENVGDFQYVGNHWELKNRTVNPTVYVRVSGSGTANDGLGSLTLIRSTRNTSGVSLIKSRRRRLKTFT